MTANRADADAAPQPREGNAPRAADPGADGRWANELRALYDAVVDEPLPESFADLLARLDDQA